MHQTPVIVTSLALGKFAPMYGSGTGRRIASATIVERTGRGAGFRAGHCRCNGASLAVAAFSSQFETGNHGAWVWLVEQWNRIRPAVKPATERVTHRTMDTVRSASADQWAVLSGPIAPKGC